MIESILPDVLVKGLKLVFCGTAVGNRSANVSAYYAGQNNKFWKVLHEIGLTPIELRPEDYFDLPKYGIGLTDLVKQRCGNDSNLTYSDYDVVSFKNKIKNYKPKILAFNGKQAAKIFYGVEEVDYGFQKDNIDLTSIYILPSTSGQAQRYWDNYYWQDVAQIVRGNS